jgi:hypothetical protein
MRLIIPMRFTGLYGSRNDVTELSKDIRNRISDGHETSEVVDWAVSEDWDREFAEWLAPWVAENGIPSSVSQETATVEKEAPALSEFISRAAPQGPRAILAGNGAASPAAEDLPGSGTAILEIAAETGMSGAPLEERISPLASAFPSWDIMPPQSLVKRIRRPL